MDVLPNVSAAVTGVGTTVTVSEKCCTSPIPTVLDAKHLFVGCGLAIGGNLLISVSLNLQKYTHMKNEKEEIAKHYLHSPIWWLGIILMVLGEFGNFSAYGFAPASLVAPLGTTTVVANMFIAVIFLKEKLRPEDLFGSTLAGVGAFLLVSFAQHDEAVLNAREIAQNLIESSFIIYVVLELTAVTVLLVLKYKFGMENVLVLLLITSLLASFTVISAKAVSGMLQLTLLGEMQLDKAIFYFMLLVMAVTCVIQVKYLNQAMKMFNSTVVVPTNFVFFTISAIVAGIVFYKEFWGMTALQIVLFLFGCLMCFAGVYFITVGRTDAVGPEGGSPPDGSDSEDHLPDGSFHRIYHKYVYRWLPDCCQREDDRRDKPTSSRVKSDEVPIIMLEQSLSDDSSTMPDKESPSLQGDSVNLSKTYGATD